MDLREKLLLILDVNTKMDNWCNKLSEILSADSYSTDAYNSYGHLLDLLLKELLNESQLDFMWNYIFNENDMLKKYKTFDEFYNKLITL